MVSPVATASGIPGASVALSTKTDDDSSTKTKKVVASGDARRKLHRLVAGNVSIARGMRSEHQHHGNRLRTLECDVVACPDLHENLLEYVALGKPNDVPMVPDPIEQMLGFSLCGPAKVSSRPGRTEFEIRSHSI